MKRRFVVLDRDGTIIRESSYLADPGRIELIPGAPGALRRLMAMGLGLAVITNQSGVGRGLFSEEQLDRIHARLREILDGEGVRLDGIYYCPHKPADDCSCRKPAIGLLSQASEELGFDPRESFVVGDKWSDIEMGRRAAAVTLLVRTGYGAQAALDRSVKPDYVVRDLAEAAEIIEALLASDSSHSI